MGERRDVPTLADTQHQTLARTADRGRDAVHGIRSVTNDTRNYELSRDAVHVRYAPECYDGHTEEAEERSSEPTRRSSRCS